MTHNELENKNIYYLMLLDETYVEGSAKFSNPLTITIAVALSPNNN